MAESEKLTTTLAVDTVQWLRDEYPDAMSDQEAIRMAISDARMLRENTISVSQVPDTDV